MNRETETVVDRYGVERPVTILERLRRKTATVPRVDGASGKPLPLDEQYEAVRAANTRQP